MEERKGEGRVKRIGDGSRPTFLKEQEEKRNGRKEMAREGQEDRGREPSHFSKSSDASVLPAAESCTLRVILITDHCWLMSLTSWQFA